jgi:hypothetical protein
MAGAANSTYAIHPALGIARMGNAVASPDDPSTWYLGAESPYEVPNKGQPYKIGTQVKKQAQRFRIYEFQDGQALREITLQQSDVAGIEWTVHLANRKAALHTDLPPGTVSKPAAVPPPVYGPPASNGWKPDQGKYDASYWPAQTRNASVPPGQRARLCIDAGPQTVVGNAGPNGETKNLVGTISFPRPNRPPVSKSVMLGSLSTEDRTGRLLVFGGNGLSEGILEGEFSPHAHVDEWGNNDGWHDDTSDGWVLDGHHARSARTAGVGDFYGAALRAVVQQLHDAVRFRRQRGVPSDRLAPAALVRAGCLPHPALRFPAHVAERPRLGGARTRSPGLLPDPGSLAPDVGQQSFADVGRLQGAKRSVCQGPRPEQAGPRRWRPAVHAAGAE